VSDVDRHLETFRVEAEDLLREMEDAILLIEEDPADREAVDRLFRVVHTIKGSGGMFSLTDMVNLAHHVEAVLERVRGGTLAIVRELIDLVLVSRDLFAAMIEGAPVDLQALGQVIARLEALMGVPAKVSAAAGDRPRSKSAGGGETATFHIRFTPDPALFYSGAEPSLLLNDLRGLGACEVTAHGDAIPAWDEFDAEKCYLSWDILLTTGAGLNAIRDVFTFVEDLSRVEIEDLAADYRLDPDAPLPKLGEILVERGDLHPAALHEAISLQSKVGELLSELGKVSEDKVAAALSQQEVLRRQQASAQKDTVRVPSSKLDALINLVGELVTNQARLSEIAGTIGNMDLATPIEEADRLTAELRDLVLNVRMMPIGTTFSRFKRLVRDLASELGKEIDLATEGAETELDKTVIDRLYDPLVHLIRNSVDHGVEPPDVRLKAGKPRHGTIRLTAAHRGAHVVISIIDDGKGLDVEAIRRKAIDRQLIPADRDLSDKDVFSLIFHPGLSTAAKVTDVSGRGVGMDVVKREIDALRGSVDVDSRPGRGTTIALSLPLTLAIIDGLLVALEGDRYVIPLSAIEECMELTPDRFATSAERNVIQVRGTPVPLVRLRDVFHIATPRPPLEKTVVVSVGDFRVGIVVDDVIGNHQTVIKSLGRLYRDANCISGATIMGDGNVALILDLAGLIRCSQTDEAEAVAAVRCSASG
jgi:two-component system chemotaxis sensor kinase CheA